MPPVSADAIAVYVYRRPAPGVLEFLQIRRSDETGEYQRSWQIVYGGIEKGETAEQAALRELSEEIGLRPEQIKLMLQVEYIETFYFRPNNCIIMMPVFSVEISPDTPLTLNSEHDGLRWINMNDIPTYFMWRSQREALHAVMDEILHPSLAHEFLTIKIDAKQ